MKDVMVKGIREYMLSYMREMTITLSTICTSRGRSSGMILRIVLSVVTTSTSVRGDNAQLSVLMS
jgi:hypothetical protein